MCLITLAVKIYCQHLLFLGAYEQIRNSGFLDLPHRTTLNQYTGFTEIGCGFKIEVIERLKTDLEFEKLTVAQKSVVLLFDEMKIKSGLVYSKATGKFLGFTDLGGINEELDEFERLVKGGQPKKFATHVIGFMIRGLTTRYNYPIGYYAGCGFDSDQLYAVVWEAVECVEMAGFQVRAFTCDGASPNRRFFKLNVTPDGSNTTPHGVINWVWNLYAVPQRKIFFFSDPPHLMKTLRNNFENSHGHKNTRHLMVSFFFIWIISKVYISLKAWLFHRTFEIIDIRIVVTNGELSN